LPFQFLSLLDTLLAKKSTGDITSLEYKLLLKYPMTLLLQADGRFLNMSIGIIIKI